MVKRIAVELKMRSIRIFFLLLFILYTVIHFKRAARKRGRHKKRVVRKDLSIDIPGRRKKKVKRGGSFCCYIIYTQSVGSKIYDKKKHSWTMRNNIFIMILRVCVQENFFFLFCANNEELSLFLSHWCCSYY